MDAAFWDDRYAAEEYAYGETPNAGVAKILEAYTPAQLALGTGGPKAPELLMTLDSLRDELSGLEFIVARELERDVTEGTFHHGRGAVVQILARRPQLPVSICNFTDSRGSVVHESNEIRN